MDPTTSLHKDLRQKSGMERAGRGEFLSLWAFSPRSSLLASQPCQPQCRSEPATKESNACQCRLAAQLEASMLYDPSRQSDPPSQQRRATKCQGCQSLRCTDAPAWCRRTCEKSAGIAQRFGPGLQRAWPLLKSSRQGGFEAEVGPVESEFLYRLAIIGMRVVLYRVPAPLPLESVFLITDRAKA